MEDRTKGILYMLTVVAIWGFSFVATKVLLNYLDPATIGFTRFFIATVLLFAICRKREKYALDEVKYVAIAGFLGITCYYMFENVALTFTTATNSSLIGATVPVFFLFTIDALRRKFSKTTKYIGAFIAFVGVGLLILNGTFNLNLNPLGDFLMFGSVFSWIFYTLIIDRLGSRNMLIVSRDLTLSGTIFLLPFALYEAQDLRIDIFSQNDLLVVVAALIYLGLFCSALGFLFWNKAIHLAGSSTTTNGIYLLPLVTIIGDSIIIGNVPNIYVMIGTMLVLAGVYLSERNGNGRMKDQ
ncbi:DMT family transporter [Methanococcoides methylutens]|uniref:Permease of the drug/metabolite transporter (DMT) superfamily n=1 Tax=Methanococcoides methylutens MM1 TaxID=1434104 RepID=A0A0E3SR74_METMT|nr:DMT family transporter [Methanococcoides methylutens]AKB85341.1 Permease of the drug/metabolite transporter (DMT) superfamily [Methanococcoides methylutens MM1]